MYMKITCDLHVKLKLECFDFSWKINSEHSQLEKNTMMVIKSVKDNWRSEEVKVHVFCAILLFLIKITCLKHVGKFFWDYGVKLVKYLMQHNKAKNFVLHRHKKWT